MMWAAGELRRSYYHKTEGISMKAVEGTRPAAGLVIRFVHAIL